MARSPARKPSRARARPRPGPRARPRLLVIEQRHLDVAGLALVALGALLALVLYLGWNGGELGGALADVLVLLIGAAAYAIPLALFGAGLVLMLRPVLPSVRPFRFGTLCLFLALVLGLAAGSFGLGPEVPARQGEFGEGEFVREHGGLAGEALFWAVRTLVSDVGAHIVFVFLLVSGLLLLTGASVAGVARATGEGLTITARRVRHSTTELAAAATRRRRAPRPEEEGAPLVDPDAPGTLFSDEAAPVAGEGEPPETETEPAALEAVVRATHVEAPPLDGARLYPDLFGEPSGAAARGAPGGADPIADIDATLDLRDGSTWEDGADDPEAEDVDGAGGAEPDGLTEGGAEGASEARPAREIRPEDLTPQGRLRGSVTEAEDFVYTLPSPRVLKRSEERATRPDTKTEARLAGQLVEALGHFGIESRVVGTVSGPHVTRYELRLAPGTKMSKVSQLKDDIAYALAATDVRILAPIPGKTAVGVEVPNLVRRMVHLGDVFQDAPSGWSPLTVWLGKDIAGKAIGTDLAKQPHILVAGTTGSGKSGAVNAMLSSILLRATPNEVKLVLVDPKQVELNHYESIPHLLTPVITSPRKASNALANLVREMEQRYSIMSLAKSRSLVELNRSREARGERPLPYILCVIDELADLMMVAPADVEDAIIRLAQKSRAVGIHLLLATQRPSADIITGMIKANVPARMAFAVSSQTDSRVILDQNGAESLLGQGDMLFRPASESRPNRIQGAFIGEDEIARLTTHWRRQGEPELHEELLEPSPEDAAAEETDEFDPDADDLLPEAIATVVQMGSASTSMLQRRLRVGYTRAGRLIDMMERRAVISGYEGSKARQVLVNEAELPRILEALADPMASEPVGAGAEELD